MEQRRDVAHEECAWMQIHHTVELYKVRSRPTRIRPLCAFTAWTLTKPIPFFKHEDLFCFSKTLNQIMSLYINI